jgi:predicted NBD/HSP70 family sugar kinase
MNRSTTPTMATPHPSTRSVVLELVRRGEAATRTDLGHLTGLSRSVVAQVVGELIAEGLLAEGRSVGPARRGRPSSHIRLAPLPGIAAGIDVGHRHVAVAVAGLDGQLLCEQVVHHDVDADAAGAFRVATTLLGVAARQAGATTSELLAVGLSLPFPVIGPARAVAPIGEVPGWDGARPRDLLRLDPGVALVIDNDADAGAWGELRQEREARSLLYVKVGEGLGAALVVDGELLSGAHGLVGEIGHVRVPGSVLQCRCGSVGCLDAIVSRAFVAPSSAQASAAAGEALGAVLAQLASFADPAAVVLGGELSTRPELAERTASSYARHCSGLHPAPLRTAVLGRRSELWGALDRAVREAWTRLAGTASYALAR